MHAEASRTLLDHNFTQTKKQQNGVIIIIIIVYLYSALRELNLELGALQVLKESMINAIHRGMHAGASRSTHRRTISPRRTKS